MFDLPFTPIQISPEFIAKTPVQPSKFLLRIFPLVLE